MSRPGTKLHSTNAVERLNGEIKRRTEVVGIFPNEPSSDWSTPSCSNKRRVGREAGARYMTLETVAPFSDDPIVSLPAATA